MNTTSSFGSSTEVAQAVTRVTWAYVIFAVFVWCLLTRKVLWDLHTRHVLVRAPRWYRQLFIVLVLGASFAKRFMCGPSDPSPGGTAAAVGTPSATVEDSDSESDSESEGPPPFAG